MLADSIVIAITVARTFKLRREASHMHMPSPLMDCLLRDGKRIISSNITEHSNDSYIC